MKKSKVNILIVEDDQTVGKALDAAFQRAGYKTTLCKNSATAEKAIRLNDYHVAFVDCMIPGKNGLDLSVTLKKENPHLNIYLTSGIFKDKQYIQDALSKTRATNFFVKPFDLENIVSILDEQFFSETDSDVSGLNLLLGEENYSLTDRVNAVNSSSPINAFNLPLVYSLLIDGKATGDLEINYPEAGQSIIRFTEGQIEEVIHFDKESYFGLLLIEHGFIESDDLQRGLASNSNKRIGEKLVDINSLSPHAINIVQVEQMKIRLSKTLTNASVEVQFNPTEREPAPNCVDNLTFSYSLNDWIQSKLDTDWLSNYYTIWLDRPISLGPNASKYNLLAGLPVLLAVPKIMKTLEEFPYSLNELFEKFDSEESVLKAIHLLAMERVIYFSANDETKSTNYEIKEGRLKKILEQFNTQNYFEILGLSNDARSTEIQRAYTELAKALHPDKIGPKEPQAIKDLSQEIFSKITQAYQVLKDDKKRKTYERELKVGKAEDILKLEHEFNQGLAYLNKGNYKEAYKIFKAVIKQKGHRKDTAIYYTWAKVKARFRLSSDSLAIDIKEKLDQVPHEDRHSKEYFYARGLYYLTVRNNQKAYNCFKQCLALDSEFKEAKRELSLMKRRSHEVSSESTFIGKIFGTGKRKKSG